MILAPRFNASSRNVGPFFAFAAADADAGFAFAASVPFPLSAAIFFDLLLLLCFFTDLLFVADGFVGDSCIVLPSATPDDDVAMPGDPRVMFEIGLLFKLEVAVAAAFCLFNNSRSCWFNGCCCR